jgi:hypothetical protein
LRHVGEFICRYSPLGLRHVGEFIRPVICGMSANLFAAIRPVICGNVVAIARNGSSRPNGRGESCRRIYSPLGLRHVGEFIRRYSPPSVCGIPQTKNPHPWLWVRVVREW